MWKSLHSTASGCRKGTLRYRREQGWRRLDPSAIGHRWFLVHAIGGVCGFLVVNGEMACSIPLSPSRLGEVSIASNQPMTDRSLEVSRKSWAPMGAAPQPPMHPSMLLGAAV